MERLGAALAAALLFAAAPAFGAETLFRDETGKRLPAKPVEERSMDAAAGDVDGDGDLDLVVAMEFLPNKLLLNDGKGHFKDVSAERLPQTAFDSEEIALGDFDRDGDLDIIIACEDDARKEYFLNDGQGHFSDVSDRLPQRGVANGVEAFDADRDGDLDLAIANAWQDFLWINDGKGSFSDETRDRLPIDHDTTQDFTAVDIDNDGDLDLVKGNEDGNMLYLNNGWGKFTDASSRMPPSPAEEMTRKVAAGDVDNDGDIDLYFANLAFRKGLNAQDRLLMNTSRGSRVSFADETQARRGFDPLSNAHAGFHDLDGDGDLDLAVAELTELFKAGEGPLRAYLNDGTGRFTEATAQVFPPSAKGNGFDLVEADFDGDGRTDLYLANRYGKDVLLMRR